MLLRTSTFVFALLLGLVFGGSAKAQIVFGDFGFVVAGTNGSAGDVCWGFDCTPRQLAVLSSETLSVTVRAPLGAPYAVFASPAIGACFPIPGIYHEFHLDPSFLLLVFVGTIDRPNPALFCYDGLTVQSLPLPPVPSGATVFLQAAAVVGTPLFPATGLATSSVVQLTAQ
jgi:hypothetical protein